MGDWRLFFLYRDRLRKVALQDVQRVAEQYLKPANRVLGEFKGTGAHLVSSNLSGEQEAKLREVFAEDEAQAPTG